MHTPVDSRPTAPALHVAQLWRYPVKSMAGERLRAARLGEEGVDGDRRWQVRDATGRVLTARRSPGLLSHRATVGPDGEPLVDGRRWDDAAVAEDVRRAAGPGAHLLRVPADERFDVLPLLVLTDGALRAFGRDVRRLRPNILVGGVDGLAERGWEGRVLRLGGPGGAVVALDDLRGRCVMTTWDPDTGRGDPGVLKDIARRFDGALGLNAWVLRGGTVAEGDLVELLPTGAEEAADGTARIDKTGNAIGASIET